MRLRTFFSFLLLFFFTFSLQAQEKKNPFLAEWDDSIQKVHPGQNYELKVKFTVPEGFYLYKDKTEINPNVLTALELVKKTFPAGKLKLDPFIKKEVEVYLHSFEVNVLFKVAKNATPGRQTLEGEIKYQGCSQDFCYRPMKTSLLVPIEVLPAVASVEKKKMK